MCQSFKLKIILPNTNRSEFYMLYFLLFFSFIFLFVCVYAEEQGLTWMNRCKHMWAGLWRRCFSVGPLVIKSFAVWWLRAGTHCVVRLCQYYFNTYLLHIWITFSIFFLPLFLAVSLLDKSKSIWITHWNLLFKYDKFCGLVV